MKVYSPDGTKWRVRRGWDASRGRPRAGGLLPLVYLIELIMELGNLIGSLFFDRPWVISARSWKGETRWLVAGWDESAEAVAFVARTLRATGKPPAYVPGDKTPLE